jgi:hypothetical protein
VRKLSAETLITHVEPMILCLSTALYCYEYIITFDQEINRILDTEMESRDVNLCLKPLYDPRLRGS